MPDIVVNFESSRSQHVTVVDVWGVVTNGVLSIHPAAAWIKRNPATGQTPNSTRADGPTGLVNGSVCGLSG
jgi:hypothetical protein